MSGIMSEYEVQAKLFKTLNHPARLAILEVLRSDEQCVCHLEATLGLRQAYISQQLIILREAGIIQDRRDGWNIFYRVAKPEIYSVIDAAQQITGASPGQRLAVRSGDRNTVCECPKCKQEVELYLA